ncbi:HD domain-containing protein [Leekyejoonella antrihumi]|uniref:Metal-dependent phosphohydrolase n=1 Tax=Leekyejoonella antrihumi TaxID=1660198 RepID=A0A563E5S2_9MICO|nr:hypothetical protein [Leekyejoonella antrihumi]TWP37639.1 hypothetical protein FGL98_05365 [Leekyejoonella antrihumi]
MPALIARWSNDVTALSPGADPDRVLDTGADLLRRWTQPHRHYHTTQHLAEVFWALEEVLDDEPLARVGRLAGWLHDAVYAVGPAAGANERLSAELARDLLPPLGIDSATVQTVGELVEMTADHDPAAGSSLGDAFHDADLWILSAPPLRFDEYCDQVRAEYAQVPDTSYAQGRGAILQPLLQRDQLYRTSHAQTTWTDAARRNLTRELDRLATTTLSTP